MNDGASFAIAIAVTLGVVAGVVGLAGGALWAGLGPDARAAIAAAIAPRTGLLVFGGLLGIGLAALTLQPAIRAYLTGARRLAEEARIILAANRDYQVSPGGPPGLRELGAALNDLGRQMRVLREETDAKIAMAKASVEDERNRLAALMSELTQGVAVCNREGRILLYNQRARELLGGASAQSAALVGLGRSIFGVVDRQLIGHALDTVVQRLGQGDAAPVTHFLIAARDGRLLRVHLTPVLGHAVAGAGPATQPEIAGFVLTLDDVTRAVEDDSRRDQVIHALTEGSRAAIANVRAAAESLLEYRDMDDAQRDRFLAVIAEEARALSTRLDATLRDHAESLKTRWPLEDVLGVDLVEAAQRRIESRAGIAARLEAVDPALWLQAESYSLAQALAYLAVRLRDESGVRDVRFRLARSGRHAALDLVWAVPGAGTQPLDAWLEAPMSAAGEESPLSVRDVVERHGGEVWHDLGAGRGAKAGAQVAERDVCFRLLIPAGSVGPHARRAGPVVASRPEYYDFDLFHQPGQTSDLDARPLAELAYTVFDTETTGLDPAGGDEIISIGAVRIVNGRLLRHEIYDQLIDPRRPLAQASIAIHGISPEMLAGQPTIDRVLPTFHTFSEDTVLVGHNAAFDMRFLQLKETATGVRFTQPVLDTLLLSEVLHPSQELHRLEAIAERFGIDVVGRHTALGDAIVTGEVFLRMIPLLAERGIRTLGEARAAAQRTYYAQVKY